MSVQISCATDNELITMRNKSSYTEYFIKLIKTEINKRKVIGAK